LRHIAEGFLGALGPGDEARKAVFEVVERRDRELIELPGKVHAVNCKSGDDARAAEAAVAAYRTGQIDAPTLWERLAELGFGEDECEYAVMKGKLMPTAYIAA
jgi:hypothetical protein